jgi:hypothetical protein
MYLWSEEWIGEGGSEEEMAECVGIPASASGLTRVRQLSIEAQAFFFLRKI